MPLDKFVLMIVIVIAAAGATVWFGALFVAAVQLPGPGWLLFVPALLVGYVAWRVLSERLSNSEDDHYDRIEK